MSLESLNILKKKGILPSQKQETRKKTLKIKGFTQKDQIFLKETRYPLIKKMSVFHDQSSLEIPFLEKNYLISNLTFFDVETTGLSTGSGSVVFLAGIGQIIDNQLVITQVFLDSYEGEAFFLKKIAGLLDKKTWITYNGKSFDAPIYKSRITFQNTLNKSMANRMVAEPVLTDHIDLLHFMRRFFKEKMESFTLSSVENYFLQEPRPHDISGAEVPLIYFDFIKDKNPQPLQQIFYHNEIDILSLVKILGQLVTFFQKENYKELDPYSSSRYFMREKKMDLAESVLSSEQFNQEFRSIKMLSGVYKKKGDYQQAKKLWQRLAYESTDFDLYPYEELAKYYEHIEKDFSLALDWVNQAMQKIEIQRSLDKFIDFNLYQLLNKRKLRLLQKIHKITR
ncbi:MAG: ribonuclease H-like domain-containing protein [Spirochaetes bacterium]|nr:ribonuclease H-like domain-containing protein [Spirochaetota bacterium]